MQCKLQLKLSRRDFSRGTFSPPYWVSTELVIERRECKNYDWETMSQFLFFFLFKGFHHQSQARQSNSKAIWRFESQQISFLCVKVFTVDLLESHDSVDFVRTLFITWPIVRQKWQCLPITRHIKMAAIANMRRLHLTTGDCINRRLHLPINSPARNLIWRIADQRDLFFFYILIRSIPDTYQKVFLVF